MDFQGQDTGLHDLDLGAARFIELQLTLVIRKALEIDVLRSAAFNLAGRWPALVQRMNFTRTKFQQSAEPDILGFWKSRVLDTQLDDELPYLQDLSNHSSVDSNLINNLITFEESFTDQFFTRALTIRVASLVDACLIHFTVQHPFCDANGVYRIAEAYCAILEGKPLSTVGPGPRAELKLRSERNPKSHPTNSQAVETVAVRHAAFYSHGWSSLLLGGLRQLSNKWGGPKRVEKTAMIPNSVIDELEHQAQLEGIRVTRHDLLMAWIYHKSIPEPTSASKKRTAVEPPQFSFIMNIAKQLQHDPDFHNPWIVVCVPELELSSLYDRAPVIAIADLIRKTILDARRSSSVEQILAQHRNVQETPMGPAYWGCREPNVAVSSWTNLSLYELEIVSKDGQRNKPAFIQVGVKVCPALRAAGLSFADGVLTWMGKDGF